MTSSPPTIMDMPENVLSMIFENTDFVAVQALRKVCHHFRNFIDDVKPSGDLDDIKITISHEEDDANPNTNIYIQYSSRKNNLEYNLNYKNSDKGFEFTNRYHGYKGYRHRTKRYENGENFLKFFQKDLELVMESVKNSTLQRLQIEETRDSGTQEIMEEVLRGLNLILKARRRPLRVRNLIMSIEYQHQVMQVLPYLQPGVLTDMEFWNPIFKNSETLELSEIVQLDQWKEAKEIAIRQFSICEPFSTFYGFHGVCISVPDMSLTAFLELKNTLQQSPNLEYFTAFIDNVTELQELFNSYSEANNNDWSYVEPFFQVPNPEKVLRMQFSKPGLLSFALFDGKDVPPHTLIRE